MMDRTGPPHDTVVAECPSRTGFTVPVMTLWSFKALQLRCHGRYTYSYHGRRLTEAVRRNPRRAGSALLNANTGVVWSDIRVLVIDQAGDLFLTRKRA